MAAVSFTPGLNGVSVWYQSGIVLPDINTYQHHAPLISLAPTYANVPHTIYVVDSSPTPCLLPTYSFAAFYGSKLVFSCNDEPVLTLSSISSRPNQTNGFLRHDARGRGCRRISAMDGTTCSDEKPRPLTVIFRGSLVVAVCLVPARTAAGTYMQLSVQFDSSRLHFNLVSSSFRSGGGCSTLSAFRCLQLVHICRISSAIRCAARARHGVLSICLQ